MGVFNLVEIIRGYSVELYQMSNIIIRGSPYQRIIRPKMPSKIFVFDIQNLYLLPQIGASYKSENYTFWVIGIAGNKIKCVSNCIIDNLYPKGVLTKLSGTGQNSMIYTNKESNNDFDWTGYQLQMLIVKNKVDNPQAIDIVYPLQTYTLQPNQPTNRITVAIDQTVTATLPVGKYYQVFQIVDSLGNKFENIKVDTELISIDINQIT